MQNEVIPIIEVDSLTTSFFTNGEWVPAIINIGFSIHKSETVALVGESGSGKSVSSLSITRLLPAKTSRFDSGEIKFNRTISLTNLSEKEFRGYRTNKISMIFQDPMSSLNPVQRCGNQVAEAIKLHLGHSKKQAKEKVIQLFNDVELPDPEVIYKKYPFELSGGQKQRVMIALAMSCEPELLIADEPTTALDPLVSLSILELIKKLQKKNNMGVLFITHDLDILSGFADRVLVMYQGTIVEEGSSDSILKDPKHSYTRALIACKPPKDSRPRRLPTVADFIGNENFIPEIETAEERIAIHKKIYDQQPLISVKDVSVHFPISHGLLNRTKSIIKAVDKVSFDMFEGETLGLIGPSGCGKTTLGRSLLRLTDVTSGSIGYKGKNILALGAKELIAFRREVQIIFQDPFSSLNPMIKIGKSIAEPLMAHGVSNKKESEEKVKHILEKVGLKQEYFNRYPHEFSGGQRQRIGIARALILSPKILVCDESVSALDVSIQAQILNLLNDLKKEFGLTFLFISHDMDVVRYFSDRVITMEKGKIKAIGKSEEILG